MPVIINAARRTGCALCLYECRARVFAFDVGAFKSGAGWPAHPCSSRFNPAVSRQG